jgi:hypothetical protein
MLHTRVDNSRGQTLPPINSGRGLWGRPYSGNSSAISSGVNTRDRV